MLIRNVTHPVLIEAMIGVNKYFSGNICFYESPQPTGILEVDWRVRLYTNWAYGKGALRGFYTGRCLRSACCHVHGLFFEALPKGTIVYANGRKYKTGTPWVDWKRGLLFTGIPIMQSTLCRCNGKSQEAFYEKNDINICDLLGIPRAPSKVLSNWDDDVLKRFELSRQRYEDGNLLVKLN